MTPAIAGEAATAVDGFDGGAEMQNKFRLVALAVRRARQLHAGARPRVERGSHKLVRVAVLEVLAGTISWSVADKAAQS